MTAYSEDPNGNEFIAYNQMYVEGPAGSHTPVSLFHPGITRIRIYSHNNTSTAQGLSFGLDALKFITTDSASAL